MAYAAAAAVVEPDVVGLVDVYFLLDVVVAEIIVVGNSYMNNMRIVVFVDYLALRLALALENDEIVVVLKHF